MNFLDIHTGNVAGQTDWHWATFQLQEEASIMHFQVPPQGFRSSPRVCNKAHVVKRILFPECIFKAALEYLCHLTGSTSGVCSAVQTPTSKEDLLCPLHSEQPDVTAQPALRCCRGNIPLNFLQLSFKKYWRYFGSVIDRFRTRRRISLRF